MRQVRHQQKKERQLQQTDEAGTPPTEETPPSTDEAGTPPTEETPPSTEEVPAE